MVTYFIDAFNLLHKIQQLEDSASPRNDLINYIRANDLTGNFNNPVYLVFDGFATNEFVNDAVFNVIFSGSREADDIIKERVSSFRNKRDLIVVSDDNEIRDHARMEGAKAMHDAEFLEKANKRKIKKIVEPDDKKLDTHTMEEITEELKNVWIKK